MFSGLKQNMRNHYCFGMALAKDPCHYSVVHMEAEVFDRDWRQSASSFNSRHALCDLSVYELTGQCLYLSVLNLNSQHQVCVFACACMCVCVCVCVCVWRFDLKSKLWIPGDAVCCMSLPNSLLLSFLPVNHTPCIGRANHYKLDCLGIESRLASDFLQLSRPALRPIQYNGDAISFLGYSGQGVALSTHDYLAPKWKKEMCVWVCVRVCVWHFDLKSKLGTQAMQYVACNLTHSLPLFSLPVKHTPCIGKLAHYKLECLWIQSRLARDFLQLSRIALGPTQYNGYVISFLG